MLTKRIVILIFDGVNLLDACGPAQVFTQANSVQANRSTRYLIQLASKQGGLVSCDSGIKIETTSLPDIDAKNIDTLIIAGGGGVHQTLCDDELIQCIIKISKQSSRTGSVCTGAYLLAATGLLDHKRAVTHWKHVDQLQAKFPDVNVECDPIYICENNIWSCAGICAGIDLALAMLERDLGHESTLQTARELVVYLKRPGGQSQFSTLLLAQSTDNSGLFNDLHVWIMNNLDKRLTTDRLAERMNMSSRNFFRLYKANLGKTPAKSIEQLRLQSAKRKLENKTLGIARIASLCGFTNEETMRRAFIRNFRVSPYEYRKHFCE